MQSEFVELVLTCEDQTEAQKIADALLKQRLIACAKFLPVKSKFWWKGQLGEVDEVMLLMESVTDNFGRIEAEVAKLHSYETFVLQATPITHINKAAATWLTESTE